MLRVGSKVKFLREKQMYTVRASSERFAVCTKPFNLKKTVMYTIIDFVKDIRGTDNLVFGMGYETDEDCLMSLQMLESGEMEITRRNNIPLDIELVKDGKQIDFGEEIRRINIEGCLNRLNTFFAPFGINWIHEDNNYVAKFDKEKEQFDERFVKDNKVTEEFEREVNRIIYMR